MIQHRIVITTLLAVLVSACGLVPSEPVVREVVREVLVTVQVPVTSEPLPTYSPYPTYTSYPTYTPLALADSIETTGAIDTPTSSTPVVQDVDGVIAKNYLGEMESNGVKVELVRVIVGNTEALKSKFPDMEDYFGDEPFNRSNVLMEIWYRISNNTDEILKFDTWPGGTAFINDEQINLEDFYSEGAFGITDGTIYPGKSVVGGYWLPVSSIENIAESRSVGFGLKPLYDDDYDDVTDNFFIVTDVDPTSWGYEELPDELK